MNHPGFGGGCLWVGRNTNHAGEDRPEGQGVVRAAGGEGICLGTPWLTAAAGAVARREGGGKGIGASLGDADPDRRRQRQGATSEGLAWIKELKATIRRLEEDNDILRRASIVFAGELDPRNHRQVARRWPRGRVDLPGPA